MSTNDHPITVDSVLLILHDMAKIAPTGYLSPTAQKLALQYLVDRRECPICGALPTQWCYTYGWTTAVLRTHTARLQMTGIQRRRAVHWALNQELRMAGRDLS